jgi:pyruvate kinase
MSDRPRRTKILATLGPATDRPGVLAGLIAAGIDGARINCAYGTPDEWRARTAAVRRAAADAGRHVCVVFDLCGPKIRLAHAVDERAVAVGEEVAFAAHDGDGAPHADGAVGVAWGGFADLIAIGRSEIVLGDGTPRFLAEAVEGTGAARRIVTRCATPGVIRPGKGVAITFAQTREAALTDKDLADLDVAAQAGADLVALSFVRSARDLLDLREQLARRRSAARIVAKIEKTEAIEDLDDVLEAADGVMVARGDLGVEAGVARVPLLQKEIVHRATLAGKLAITATQMLETMVDEPEPTRAEAADVANAVLDGTSALMLSAETAVGRYPVESVRAMAEIALAAEEGEPFSAPLDLRQSDEAAVVQAAVVLARAIDAEALVIPTTTGGSARACAKHRPAQRIVALVTSTAVASQLALEWGVQPTVIPEAASLEAFVELVLRRAQEVTGLPDGSRVVLTYGPVVARPGSTNLIVVERLGRRPALMQPWWRRPPRGQGR